MTASDLTPPPGAKTAAVSSARLAAFRILQRVEVDGAFASVLLAVGADELKPNDRSLCHELVMGVLRSQLWLDTLILHYANRAADRLDVPVRLALRLGLYQLRFLSRIPPSAAVNESVKLMRQARMRSAETLVNAVLRRATREPDFDPVAGIADPISRLSVETSHPVWLLDRWVGAFGFQEAAAFARANNEAPPTSIRVVRRRADEASTLAALRAAGAALSLSPVVPGAWRISGTAGELLRHFASEGRIYLQDEASQLVARVLDAQPGERVLDVCAAPGSKTTYIADRTGDRSFIVAGDRQASRLRSLKKNSETQHLSSIHCVVLDGVDSLPFPNFSFDRVLVDAPCTGTGTLRRNPEIRWRITPGDIDDLASRQSRILQNASQTLKPGGRLVYSTCSVELEENEAITARFLSENDDFKPAAFPADASFVTTPGWLRTWPHRDGVDGFFIAAFTRR